MLAMAACNAGDCTWEEARDRAMQTKMRRDARAIVEQSRTREEPSAGGKHWPREDLRDRSERMEGTAPKSVIVKVHEKKKKKRRSHKSKRDRDESPTPEVDRDRRRRDRPPSSSDEEPRTSKRPRRRQLVITLPDHVRF